MWRLSRQFRADVVFVLYRRGFLVCLSCQWSMDDHKASSRVDLTRIPMPKLRYLAQLVLCSSPYSLVPGQIRELGQVVPSEVPAALALIHAATCPDLYRSPCLA